MFYVRRCDLGPARCRGYVEDVKGRFLLPVAGLGLVAWWLAPRAGQGSVVPPGPCRDSGQVRWDDNPRRGAIFRVYVSDTGASTLLNGSFAGEPLHFAADSVGQSALAAAPIDGDSLRPLRIWCGTGPLADTITEIVSLSAGDYPVERLRVAPRFGRAPDSALAARTRRETARALSVARLSHSTPRLWTDDFLVPRSSRVTSPFGSAREFNGAITSRHMGTDFAGATGAPVMAANRGVVRIVAQFYYGGNVIYLDHGAGVTTAYLHLSRQLVQVGDTVERGQQIGRVGATGRVTGPHLHVILRYGEITVDPLSLFDAPDEPAEARPGH